MMAAAAHRGPDGTGRHVSGGVALGHLRHDLAPESVGETQPRAFDNGAIVLTASARIDNRADLIRILRPAGLIHVARPTDSDLIAASYRKWGTDCASFLIGDYAFALWDARERLLFAARDPMALRPLYYRHDGRRFLFASEVSQILAVPGVPTGLSEAAVGLHLALSPLPLEETFFEAVTQLPAGWGLQYDGQTVRTWKFWKPDDACAVRYRDHSDYADHLRELLKESVRARLRSRHPVGVWLSGGLDSGSVAATAGWLRHGNSDLPPIHAYSWIFRELPECDERHISDEIVAHYGLRVGYLSAEGAAPLNGRSPIVTHPDEPLLQVYSPLLDLALQQARADGVGIIMSGFRGDPMTESGEFDYIDLLVRGMWGRIAKDLLKYRRRVPDWPVHKILWDRFALPTGRLLLSTPGTAATSMAVREALLARRVPYPARAFPTWVNPDFARRTALKPRVRTALPAASRLRGIARRSRFQSIFHPHFSRAAVEQERHNATWGIAYADPWSDRRIAEYVLAVPANVLSRFGDEKRITRQAMRGIMPEAARRAARKIVPAPLFQRVMRQDGREAILKLFTGSRLADRGFVDECRLREDYLCFLNGGPEDPRIWNAITAEMWLRRHWN
jgi:asparagine synthase (glutamine-hydrolysing)